MNDPCRTAVISIATATIGDNTIIAAVASTPIKVYGLFFTVGGATNLIFKDGSTALSGAIAFTGAGSSQTLQINEAPYFVVAPGNAFILNSSAAVAIMGVAYYRLI